MRNSIFVLMMAILAIAGVTSCGTKNPQRQLSRMYNDIAEGEWNGGSKTVNDSTYEVHIITGMNFAPMFNRYEITITIDSSNQRVFRNTFEKTSFGWDIQTREETETINGDSPLYLKDLTPTDSLYISLAYRLY